MRTTGSFGWFLGLLTGQQGCGSFGCRFTLWLYTALASLWLRLGLEPHSERTRRTLPLSLHEVPQKAPMRLALRRLFIPTGGEKPSFEQRRL